MSVYRRPVPATWWLKRRAYFLFILRELTSVFIAVYLALFMILLYRLSLGRAPYEAYLRFLETPGMIGFHGVALAAALYHTITSMSFLPNIIVLRLGEFRVPALAYAALTYTGWIAVSALIVWLVAFR
ncbi:MAG: fumarate reductase subunit C [Anaerolineales bacterium]